MTKFFLILIALLTVALVVFILLFKRQRNKAMESAELYKEACERSVSLGIEIKRLQAAERIRTEERKHAEEKINDAHSGTARERFDAINGGLRDDAG